ncbi:MAG: hypothetical protein M3Z85_12940 [Acidobacteriota bacterium]|nr:hypothetical protein [Acidobacteriota bacterium]
MIPGEIPDVHTAAASGLRYVDLNRRVNHDYGLLGLHFQSIVDPGSSLSGVSEAYPVWFAFAAFASRGIGQAQLGAAIGLDAARSYAETGHFPAALETLVPREIAHLSFGPIGAVVHEEARLAAAFLVGFASAFSHHGAFHGLAYSSMLDPRTFSVSVHRLVELLREAPGEDCFARLSSVSLTLRNMMEDGNHRIYTDLGGAGQDYLHFRAARTVQPTPDEVLNEFALTPRQDLAKSAYRFAQEHLGEMPLPVTFGKLFPSLAGDSRPLVAAAFALYEQAGATTDVAFKNRCIAFANNYVIYREQQDVVQPAFTPGRVLPGEVDRLKLLAIITPGIEVALREEIWRFWEFAERHLPARALDPLQSRATEYNWGLFDDRWVSIVDTFGPCYRNPKAMWPPPNPDPNEMF